MEEKLVTNAVKEVKDLINDIDKLSLNINITDSYMQPANLIKLLDKVATDGNLDYDLTYSVHSSINHSFKASENTQFKANVIWFEVEGSSFSYSSENYFNSIHSKDLSDDAFWYDTLNKWTDDTEELDETDVYFSESNIKAVDDNGIKVTPPADVVDITQGLRSLLEELENSL